jgi:UDP-2-acetamido-3-amino-2,3-dideoxy-glucuronate N-acetyltransferase
VIHPSAEVDPDATVGRETSVDARTRIRGGARVGAGCVIDGDVLIDAGVVIGDSVRVQDRALIYAGAVIEDGVMIGAGAILANDRYPRAVTTRAELEAAETATAGPVTLRRGSTVGAGAVIVAPSEIGEFATVGAGAIVSYDVPSHALVGGNPARRLGWVCSCGMRLVAADGTLAEAEPPQYARHPELSCPRCQRVFVYVADADSLEERPTSEAEHRN